MTGKFIDKDMLYDFGRYLFDGLLLAVVWTKSSFTLLSEHALWTDTFGDYANAFKTSIQVIITILIAVTAIYRMLREINKYRKEKKDKK